MSYDREQQIRERAHALWEAAGRPEGQSREFWAWAEKLIEEEGPRGNRSSGSGAGTPPGGRVGQANTAKPPL